MSICITRAHGSLKLPFVVAQFINQTIRTTHVRTIEDARTVESQWKRWDFSFHPGIERPLTTRAA